MAVDIKWYKKGRRLVTAEASVAEGHTGLIICVLTLLMCEIYIIKS